MDKLKISSTNTFNIHKYRVIIEELVEAVSFLDVDDQSFILEIDPNMYVLVLDSLFRTVFSLRRQDNFNIDALITNTDLNTFLNKTEDSLVTIDDLRTALQSAGDRFYIRTRDFRQDFFIHGNFLLNKLEEVPREILDALLSELKTDFKIVTDSFRANVGRFLSKYYPEKKNDYIVEINSFIANYRESRLYCIFYLYL